MKRALVVQHTAAEFLGNLEKPLEDRGIGFVYCRPFSGQALPASALQYDSLWLLGGACPVTDLEQAPWISDEIRLVRAFRKARRPVIGFGFGALLLAQALGGATSAAPSHRAQWIVAGRTVAGANDPVAEAAHGKRVLVMVNGSGSLPAGAAPLLVDEAGDWIAMRDASSYGLLFRPELKPGMIEDMIMEDKRPLPDDISEILATARSEWTTTQRTTAAIAAALVDALDLMQERRKPPVIAIRAVQE